LDGLHEDRLIQPLPAGLEYPSAGIGWLNVKADEVIRPLLFFVGRSNLYIMRRSTPLQNLHLGEGACDLRPAQGVRLGA
jgi:hypothetical protein